jgi:hypothetical protein
MNSSLSICILEKNIILERTGCVLSLNEKINSYRTADKIFCSSARFELWVFYTKSSETIKIMKWIKACTSRIYFIKYR